jgi:hypothetical protein
MMVSVVVVRVTSITMCRSIKTLRSAEGTPSDEEIQAAALQFVRKISGYRVPSRANEEAFHRAVEEITSTSRELLDSLVMRAPARSA